MTAIYGATYHFGIVTVVSSLIISLQVMNWTKVYYIKMKNSQNLNKIIEITLSYGSW